MKKILFFSGPGFFSTETFSELHSSGDYRYDYFDLWQTSDVAKAPKWNQYDGVVLHGPYSLDAENALLVSLLAAGLSRHKELIDGSLEQTKVLGIGRGALVLLEVLSSTQWRDWLWEESDRVGGYDIDLELFWHGESAFYKGFFEQPAPLLPESSMVAWDPFTRVEDTMVGWKKKNVFLTLADPLRSQFRSQDEDFGFEGSKVLLRSSDFWERFWRS